MFAGGGLADAEFSCDQQAADAVFDEISVDLRAEVFLGVSEPGEDLEATGIGECAERGSERHIGSWLSG